MWLCVRAQVAPLESSAFWCVLRAGSVQEPLAPSSNQIWPPEQLWEHALGGVLTVLRPFILSRTSFYSPDTGN